MAVRASIARRELRASRCASLSAGVLQIDEGVADDAGGLLAIGLVDGGDGGRVESWGWSAFTAVPPEARLGTPLPNSWPVAFDQIEQRQLLLREVPLRDAHEQVQHPVEMVAQLVGVFCWKQSEGGRRARVEHDGSLGGVGSGNGSRFQLIAALRWPSQPI